MFGSDPFAQRQRTSQFWVHRALSAALSSSALESPRARLKTFPSVGALAASPITGVSHLRPGLGGAQPLGAAPCSHPRCGRGTMAGSVRPAPVPRRPKGSAIPSGCGSTQGWTERARVRQLTERRAYSVGTLIIRPRDCRKLYFLKQLRFWSWKREGTIYLIPLHSSLVCPNFLLPSLPLTRVLWDIARERLTGAWRCPCGQGRAKRRQRWQGLGCCPGLGCSAGSPRLSSPLARFRPTGRVFFHSVPDSSGTEPRSLRAPCSAELGFGLGEKPRGEFAARARGCPAGPRRWEGALAPPGPRRWLGRSAEPEPVRWAAAGTSRMTAE